MRPRTQGEPTAAGEILAQMPIATRAHEEQGRRERRRENGTETTYGPGFFTLGETENMTSAAEACVIADGVLTIGGKLLLYAAPGAGKTTLLDHLAACTASGLPFLGRFKIDRPRRVLVVQGEMAGPELASHGQALLELFRDTGADQGLVFWLQTQLKLPRDYDRLRSALIHTHAEVLILDPFIRFFNGESTTQPEEVNRLFTCIDALLEEEELLVEAAIVSHHMNVSGARTAGSWAFEAWPSTIIRLDEVRGRRDARVVAFEKVRSPDSDLYRQRLTIVLNEEGYLAQSDSDGGSPIDGRGVDRLVAYLRSVGGEAWRKDAVADLMATLGVKTRQATNVISSAKRAGVIRSVDMGRQSRLVVVDTAASD